ncbi:unnamed protein product [Pseudo-nitzschia multistriata]|uniref:Uncharacterized protein n=1 Tax=Pseudo-nitzschia multistriata TaxID=183589 RepID=A0A448ZJE7_9STRA|nr:unnamed protein product [Pseudo-nitzschia multistriata]
MSNNSMKEGKRQLSAYEQRRIDNIKRNNARLRALGLISSVEERRSNAIASGTSSNIVSGKDSCRDPLEDSDGESSDDGEWQCENNGGKKRRKRKVAPKEPREGSRKSRRLNGEQAEFAPDAEELLFSKDPTVRKKELEERVKECREVRLRAANAIAACGGEKAAKTNPTATYEHCLMRVKTMTEKGLVNRVKAIERAAGKHCVVKMAIFKSCLQDEGRWKLAEVASDALERLKALKPIPEE